MAQTFQREQVETSLAFSPRFDPHNLMAVLRIFKIMVGVTFFHLPSGVMTRASGVEGGVSWALRWITHCKRTALGHNIGYMDALCPIFFPLKALFCFVIFSVTKLAAWRSLAVAVAAKTLWL